MHNEKKDVLEFEALANFDEKIGYGASRKFNGLFKVDLRTGKCEFLMLFPGERIDGERLYVRTITMGTKIYFIPCSAKEIAIYDVESNQIEKIKIPDVETEKYYWYKTKNKFNACVLYNKYIYMIGSTYPGILRIDSRDNTVKCYNEWIEGEVIFRKSVVVIGDVFFIPSSVNNAVLCFDMKLCSGKVCNVGENNNGCWGICQVGDALWMSPKNPGPIIKWKYLENEVEEFSNYPNGFKYNNFLFTKIYSIDEYVYLVPAYSNMLVKVNINTGIMECSDIIDISDDGVTEFMFEDDKKIYLHRRLLGKDEYYYIYYLNNIVKEAFFLFDKGKDIYRNQIIKHRYIKENSFINLYDYIESVKSIC